jgi:hypothetical protein
MNRVSASAHSTRAFTLYVMVNVVEGGGRAPPTLTSWAKFFHHDGMFARKRPLRSVCTLRPGRAIKIRPPQPKIHKLTSWLLQYPSQTGEGEGLGI